MKEYSYKCIFFLFFYYQICLLQSALCKKIKKDKYEQDRKEDSPIDYREQLETLKGDIQTLTKDIAKYNTLIYIFIPTASILFLIFIGLLTYEIVKRCRKKPQNLNDQNRYADGIYSDNNNIQSNFSGSLDVSRTNFTKNTLTSTNVYESDSFLKNQNNLNNQNENIEEPNDSNNVNISGYEAPAIDISNNNNQQEEKFLTNKGEFDNVDNDNYKNISNPFLKK